LGFAVSPVEAAVFEFQPRRTELSIDPMDTDFVFERCYGRRVQNCRSGTKNVLLGKYYVLGVSGHHAHVVRCRQLFREKHKTFVRSDRDPDSILVMGQPDSPEGKRMASE